MEAVGRNRERKKQATLRNCKKLKDDGKAEGIQHIDQIAQKHHCQPQKL